MASSRASSSSQPSRSTAAASRTAAATATASAGPADPSRCARTNASRPPPSCTRPSCAYVSSPNDCAKPPAGNSPSVSCSSEISASVFMPVTEPDRREHRLRPFERHPESRQQLLHRRIVRDQQPLAIQRQRKMPVPNLERHPHPLLPRPRRHRQHRLRRRLDDDVPIRRHVKNLPRHEHAPRRQRQRQRPPLLRHHAPPPPPPLLRRQHEPIPP